MQPLDNITVVSIEQAVAAPFATRHLADLGARVLKVERPTGDFARDYDTSVNGQSSYFVWLNRNKESIVLDIKKAEDQLLLRAMLKRADVFVQNLAPGAIDRLGFGYEEVKSINPTIIYTSISGYGETGPYRDKKAYDLLVACEGGLLSITGTAAEPARVGISVVDIAAGTYAFSGILTALLARARSGQGDHLRISLLDAIGEWMGQPYLFSTYSGEPIVRSGANHVTLAPYGSVETSDGAVFLSVQNQGEWLRLCSTVLEDTTLCDHSHFRTNGLRVQHRKELQEILSKRFERTTTSEAIELLESAGIANAVLRTIEGLAEHPQLEYRNRWHQIETEGGPIRVIKPPVEVTSYDYRWDPVPRLGEHTEAIRAEFTDFED
ncbi:CaiB/BaiF CoA-transferase family protein [Candidatus Aquiluna sp. UB-MaderosW2red]|uniref:CaiB/BaiF CoA transferase family protein n=1 Tax=Candidatus Aquiluna sp. UB-MaderosW2red TaxID=1855377 RepID=UPI000875BD0F|nr:CaiB/BaiF CoA-transferase family protein [Candidatus Aquiluna sp. UB-MaderosW2red]SCX05230.1 Crotonobetainyl-CoA:carnitine CoA-transferase CaiB [Candidatus Aquiluna sp. UB-MaderosW2red]